MINFVSYSDFVKDVSKMALHLPKFDLVVGVPRSGMLPASILALHWNVPITTPELLVEGIWLSAGKRLDMLTTADTLKILLVDDSHFTGESMNHAKNLIKHLCPELKTAVVYSSQKLPDVDFCFKYVPQPRFFEWNWLHHKEMMAGACFDMDGVLCRAPALAGPQFENDYASKYDKFLETTQPRFVPTVPIKAIITGRLEEFRPQTEKWLQRHGIRYGELLMRQSREQSIPEYKAKHYSRFTDSFIFIEDEPAQAKIIQHLSQKPVLDITNKVIIQ